MNTKMPVKLGLLALLAVNMFLATDAVAQNIAASPVFVPSQDVGFDIFHGYGVIALENLVPGQTYTVQCNKWGGSNRVEYVKIESNSWWQGYQFTADCEQKVLRIYCVKLQPDLAIFMVQLRQGTDTVDSAWGVMDEL